MYKYLVYGTTIESDIQLFNIPTAEGIPTAHILITSNPSRFIPYKESGFYTSTNISAIGTFFGTITVSNGNLIEIYGYETINPADFIPYIIGWGFAFLFHQRGYTIFHCSAMNIDDKAVLLSGVSGAGKSTIALSLIEKGYKYLVDDLAIYTPEEGECLLPAYPLQKVCRDVSLKLSQAELVHINEGRDKFAYHNEADYCPTPTPLKCIILLDAYDGNDIIIQEITGLDKYLNTLSCMYLAEIFADRGTPESDKYRCLKLASQIKMLKIIRPKSKNTVSEITDTIINFVKNA